MRQPVPQTHALEQLAGLLLEDSAALPVAHYRVTNHEGRQDVFEHAQFGEQVIELKDEPEDAVAQFVARTRRQVVDPLIVERDFAHVGAVKQPQQVQERALSRARLPDNRNELAPPDFDVDPAQDGNLVLTLAIRLLDGDGGNVRLRHSDDLGHETVSREYTRTTANSAIPAAAPSPAAHARPPPPPSSPPRAPV